MFASLGLHEGKFSKRSLGKAGVHELSLLKRPIHETLHESKVLATHNLPHRRVKFDLQLLLSVQELCNPPEPLRARTG